MQLSRNAKNNFVRLSQLLHVEIRCLQLQKKVGKTYSKPRESSLKSIFFYLSRKTRFANFLEVKIFVNLSTRYSKSFIFQCLPIAADALFCSVFLL